MPLMNISHSAQDLLIDTSCFTNTPYFSSMFVPFVPFCALDFRFRAHSQFFLLQDQHLKIQYNFEANFHPKSRSNFVLTIDNWVVFK